MLPKSLHTVTVIVNVARECDRTAIAVAANSTVRAYDAVKNALLVLGYQSAEDTYGLADKARAQLARSFASEE